MKLIVMRSIKTTKIKSALKISEKFISSNGYKHIKLVVDLLKSINMIPKTIITSSLERSKQTANGIMQYLNLKIPLVESTLILPGCRSSNFLKTITNNSNDLDNDTVMAIIHEPDMRKILSKLVFPDTEFQLRILNGDICILDIKFDDIKPVICICAYFSPYLLSESLK